MMEVVILAPVMMVYMVPYRLAIITVKMVTTNYIVRVTVGMVLAVDDGDDVCLVVVVLIVAMMGNDDDVDGGAADDDVDVV